MYKKLYKARRGAKIDGVCAGLADYLNVDPTLMRVLWVIGALFLNGAGILAYFICAMVIPREPEFYEPSDCHHGGYNSPDSN